MIVSGSDGLQTDGSDIVVITSGGVGPTHDDRTVAAVAHAFGVGVERHPELEAMIRAQKGFKRSPEGSADAARLRQAYATLGVSPDAGNDEIKKAYRRLMNRSHPDKIAGDNPDAEVVAEAERRTREVRAAYEMLKARRSIR